MRGLTGFRSVVTYLPGTTSDLIAVGPQGSDFSSDGGRTWSAVTGATGLHTFAAARSGRVGWGAGEKGQILKFAY